MHENILVWKKQHILKHMHTGHLSETGSRVIVCETWWND